MSRVAERWGWIDDMEYELSVVVNERLPMALEGQRRIDAMRLLLKAGASRSEAAYLLKVSVDVIRRICKEEGITWPSSRGRW